MYAEVCAVVGRIDEMTVELGRLARALRVSVADTSHFS
jgi:hypothetical protein